VQLPHLFGTVGAIAGGEYTLQQTSGQIPT